jgi:hypothetical protein
MRQCCGIIKIKASSTPPTAPISTHKIFFRAPELNINPDGRFLAHGMIVESVSGNSFVGKVWGTSWTVNIADPSNLEFLLQNGSGSGQVTLSSVLKPGDEVGVLGLVDESHELSVNGQIVRDYSLGDMQEFQKREMEHENEQWQENEQENEHENKQMNAGENENNISSIQQQIQNILEQIKLLQEKVSGR